MKTSFASILLFSSLLHLGICQDLATCFSRFGNCDIIGHAAYTKQWRVPSETHCLAVCASQQQIGLCRSVVYDALQYICYLYDRWGTNTPAVLLPAFKKIYFQLTDVKCLSKLATLPVPSTTTSIPLLPAAECSSSESEVMVNMGIGKYNTLSEPVTFTTDAATCVQLCRVNQNELGASQPCWAVTYMVSTQECKMYSDAWSPLGQATIMFSTQPLLTVVVKICANIPGCSASIWQADRNVALVGSGQKVIQGVQQLSTCMQLCATETQFSCQSAIHIESLGSCELKDAQPANQRAEQFQPNLPNSPKQTFFVNPCAPVTAAVQKSERLEFLNVEAIQFLASYDADSETSNNDYNNYDDYLHSVEQSPSKRESPKIVTKQANLRQPKEDQSRPEASETETGWWSGWSPCAPVIGLGQQVRVQVRSCAKETGLDWNCPGDKLRVILC